MQAQDIMTRDVITVGPDMAVRDVAGLLLDKHISAAPVVDETGKLIGIVSEGDLVRRPEIAGEPRVSWWLDLISSETERARDHVKTHGRSAGQVRLGGGISLGDSGQLAAEQGLDGPSAQPGVCRFG